jgi:hypothetical protein
MILTTVLLAAALAAPSRADGGDALPSAYAQAARLAAGAAAGREAPRGPREKPAWPVLTPDELKAGPYHVRHAEIFGKDAPGDNLQVLRGVDAVQKTAPDGGGYFIGPKARPPESPIGYALALFGRPLLVPPRKTSYCSGASYSALIEALNLIFPSGLALSPERAEAMRMQEPDGGRREDRVKFWGNWNADDVGNDYALVRYSGMGTIVPPREARAGDFMNIHWKSGVSHSVVFLGWFTSPTEGKSALLWSSQPETNGLADWSAPLSRIDGVRVVRLTRPGALASFDVRAPVSYAPVWDKIDWTSDRPSPPSRP